MTETSVTIATLGMLASTIGAIVWVVKYSLRDIRSALVKHTEAADNISKAVASLQTKIEQGQQVDNELLDFMKALNGSLKKTVEEKKR